MIWIIQLSDCKINVYCASFVGFLPFIFLGAKTPLCAFTIEQQKECCFRCTFNNTFSVLPIMLECLHLGEKHLYYYVSVPQPTKPRSTLFVRRLCSLSLQRQFT